MSAVAVAPAHQESVGSPADVVLAIYRSIKTAQLHAAENQAVRRQLDVTAEVIRAHHLRTGGHVVLLFARGAVFLGGLPLRASRTVYESARELGAIIERCGGAELAIAGNITAEELRGFVLAVIATARDGRGAFADHRIAKARIRPVRPDALLRGIDVERLDHDQRIVRTYASAVVLLRRFYEGLGRGERSLPPRLKRVAQSLVDLSAGNTPAFLGVTSVRNAGHDAAGRAVNGAILAVSMARQLTSDRASLTRIAMAAMTYDAGLPRAQRSQELDAGDSLPIAALSSDVDRVLPAGTVATLVSAGGADEPAMARAVIAYESLWLARSAQLGPLYRGLRPATLHARIVAMARLYNDLLTPLPGETPRTSGSVLAELDAEMQRRAAAGDTADRTILRLLFAALDVLPAGTLVELGSGHIAVILESAEDGATRGRLVLDASGGVVSGGQTLILGRDAAHALVRVVGSDPSFAARTSSPASSPPITPMPSSIRAPKIIDERPSALPPPTSEVHVRDRPTPRVPQGEPTVLAPYPIDDASTDEDLELELPPRFAAPQTTPPRGIPLRTELPLETIAPPAKSAPPPRDLESAMESAPPSPRRPPSPIPPPIPSPPPVHRPAPAAEGTMERAPLPHLLVHLLSRSLTGSLCLTTPHGDEHIATFDAGIPQRLSTPMNLSPLGATLVRLGSLDESEVDGAVLRASSEGLLLGEQLISDGLVDEDAVTRALRDQMGARFSALVELPRATSYAFYVDTDLLASKPGRPTPVDPLALVMATVRDWTDDERMETVLAGLRDRTIGLHAAAEIARFALAQDEEEIIESMSAGWLPYADLLEAYEDRQTTVRRVVYALTITKHIDFGAAGAWPVGVARAPASSPGESTGRSSSPSISVVVPSSPSAPPPRAPMFTPVGDTGATRDSSSWIRLPDQPAPLPPPSREPSPSRPPESPRRPSSFTSTLEERLSTPPVQMPSRPRIEPHSMLVSPPKRDSIPAEPPPPKRDPPRSETAPPIDLDRDQGRREKIREGQSRLSGDLYSALGVSRDASHAQIQAAYLEAARNFHPDKVPDHLADLREESERIFVRVAEAHRTLADGVMRAAYDKKLDGGDEADVVARVMDAVSAFQKAEVLLARGDVAGAEKHANIAYDGDRENPDNLALLGWIRGMTTNRPKLLAAIDLLDQAIEKSPRSDRALFYRGSLLKRAGRVDEAMKDFRDAARENPKNLDAKREVHLHSLRNDPKSRGLFDRIFKK